MSYPGYPYGYSYGGGAPSQGAGGRASAGSQAYGSYGGTQNPANGYSGGSRGYSAFARSLAGFGARSNGQTPQYRTSQHYSSSAFDNGSAYSGYSGYSGYSNTGSTTRTQSTSYHDPSSFPGNFGRGTGFSSRPSTSSSFTDSFSGFGRASTGGNTGGFQGASSGGNTGSFPGFPGASTGINTGPFSGFSGASTGGTRPRVNLSGMRFESRGASGTSDIRPAYTVEEPDGTEEYFPPRRY